MIIVNLGEAACCCVLFQTARKQTIPVYSGDLPYGTSLGGICSNHFLSGGV